MVLRLQEAAALCPVVNRLGTTIQRLMDANALSGSLFAALNQYTKQLSLGG